MAINDAAHRTFNKSRLMIKAIEGGPKSTMFITDIFIHLYSWKYVRDPVSKILYVFDGTTWSEASDGKIRGHLEGTVRNCFKEYVKMQNGKGGDGGM